MEGEIADLAANDPYRKAIIIFMTLDEVIGDIKTVLHAARIGVFWCEAISDGDHSAPRGVCVTEK